MKFHILIAVLLLVGCSFSRVIYVPLVEREIERPDQDTLVNLRGSALPRSSITNTGTDLGYGGAFKVGEQGTKIDLLLDTGSTNLWLLSPGATTLALDTFNCSTSSTCASNLKALLNTTYVGQNGYTGYQIYDTVAYQDAVVTQFNIAYATTATNPGTSFDGIMGLGFPLTNPVPYPYALKSQSITDSSSFAVYLGLGSGTKTISGEIAFGGYNPALLVGNFTWIPMQVGATTWRTDCQGISVGPDSPIVTTTVALDAIYDTGMSYLSLPPDIMEGVLNNIKKVTNTTCSVDSSNKFFCDCNITLPPLIIYLGPGEGIPFEIPVSSYLRKNTKGCQLYFRVNGRKNSINVGATFMKNYYIMFNYDDKKIGIGKTVPKLPPSRYY